jgi:hypothetical protein
MISYKAEEVKSCSGEEIGLERNNKITDERK